LGNTGITGQQALMLAFLAAALASLLFFTLRLHAGRSLPLRPIRAFGQLKELVGRSAETGRPLHMSLGTGGIIDANTAESLAGIILMQHVAGDAVSSGASLTATVSDPTLLPLAQEVGRHAWDARLHRYPARSPDVRFIAPEPIAYSAGVMDILLGEDVAGNVMVGKFRDEYLLMGETGVHARVPQIVGGIDPQALPFIYATANEMLIGEEIFASGAYLSSRSSHVASLRTQDWLRIVVAVAIVVGILVQSL
jgi:hypothetical protein